MKIAWVCSDPGVPVFGAKGASSHARAIIGVLRSFGHQVTVITPRPGGEAPAGLAVRTLPAVAGADSAEREFSARASDAAVAAELDALDPDLVYERYSLWGTTAMPWAMAHGVPSVLEVNSPLVVEHVRHRGDTDVTAATAVAARSLTAARVVVCVSDPVADWAASLAGDGADIRVLPNGVDAKRISMTPRPAAPASGSDFTVGFLGTIRPWHGVGSLISAMDQLIAEDPSWRLLLVGGGDLAPADAELAERLGVERTGALAGELIAEQLHRMDIACAPYPATAAQDAYFSPLKVLEYLAAGIPVVAGDTGQLPQLLEHGRLGVLTPAGEVAALVTALRALRADQPRRAELATLGRAAVVAEHSWADVVRRSLQGLVPAEALLHSTGVPA